jgi:hypothetical protein
MGKRISESKQDENRVDSILNRLKRHRIIAILVVTATIVSGLAGLTDSLSRLATFIEKTREWSGPKAPVSLLMNGGFEEGFQSWGSGYYETERYHGSLPPFWGSWLVMGDKAPEEVADVRGDIVSDIRHSGKYSLKITNKLTPKAHIYGSISQRVTGLELNTDYVAEFWIKADRASPGTLQLTTDLQWTHRTSIPPGTYDWIKLTHKFNTGDKTYIDYRFISDQPGTVWLDDTTLKRVIK